MGAAGIDTLARVLQASAEVHPRVLQASAEVHASLSLSACKGPACQVHARVLHARPGVAGTTWVLRARVLRARVLRAPPGSCGQHLAVAGTTTAIVGAIGDAAAAATTRVKVSTQAPFGYASIRLV